LRRRWLALIVGFLFRAASQHPSGLAPRLDVKELNIVHQPCQREKISGSGLIRTPMAGVLGRAIAIAWVPGAISDETLEIL